MDDSQVTLETTGDQYRCPGEGYQIDRAVHLARLAAFYPACRACAHRHDVDALSVARQRQWAELERRASLGPHFTSEGLEAPSPNQIDSAVARRFATALGVAVWCNRSLAAGPPVVLVGADGNWSTAELVAAACGALQWAGCGAVEVGAATSASLAGAANHLQSDAALWIGNSTGQSHSISLKLWGRGGQPWSSPGGLDMVREIYDSDPSRPKRRGGAQRRASAEELYLDPLRPLGHALRPLRLVLDTACQAFAGYLTRLTAGAACAILPPLASQAVGPGVEDASLLERRIARLSREVVQREAHFALWVSGDGESCRLVDQRGAEVDDERLCKTLAAYVCREKPDAVLVLHTDAESELRRSLTGRGARVVSSPPTREAMFSAIEASGAVLGSGPGGQFWFAGAPTAPDALLVLCLLLTIFSQSDLPVSDVLSQEL